MNVKNIIKVVALAMLMPAMLLNYACSNEDEPVIDNENAPSRGYPLYVTVNATRQGDAGTNRASFDGTYLNFSEGDKLFVEGDVEGGAGSFAGTLTWQSGGTFSGTIYTENEYSGTIDALFTAGSALATLLPAGYESYGYLYIDTYELYNDEAHRNNYYTCATSKAAGVEQFSYEKGNYDKTEKRFVLTPKNAILNFTITGLAANTNVNVSLTSIAYMITGTVTTDAFGTATFAAGIMGGIDLQLFSLTVAGNPITLVSSVKKVAKGKIYNITRCAPVINGKFSVSSTKQVYFSKGNLQATTTDLGENWTWAFAANQWDYVGSVAANTSMKTDGTGTVTANGTVDLFGWVGASSSWTSAAKWGISASKTSADYGTVNGEALKSDWGNVPGIGSGWYTLSQAEWNYLFNTRTVNGGTGNGHSYTIGKKVNSKNGVVIYPDNYTGAAYAGSDWNNFEAAGCVFLPAGGNRNGTLITSVGLGGYYWTSTSSEGSAYYVYYTMSTMNTSTSTDYRYNGCSVRLVRNAN